MKLIDPYKRYYKGNTHTHTSHSDGRRAPGDVLRIYRAQGYDFLVISDHWKVYPTANFEGMLVMSGIEYDFEFARQVLHVVGIFPHSDAADVYEYGMGHRRLIEAINQAGGAAIAAHPAWSHNTADFLDDLGGACAAEVYNSFSGPPWNPPLADASAVLDELAKRQASRGERCLPWLAADDSHFYDGEQCMSWTMVQADALTSEAIIAALKRGSFYATQGPQFLEAEIEGGIYRVKSTPVRRCTFISDAGRTTVNPNAQGEYIYQLRPQDHYIRCETEDTAGKRAWLSPVTCALITT